MKKTKKILCATLALIMALSFMTCLTACSNEQPQTVNDVKTTEEPIPPEQTKDIQEPTDKIKETPNNETSEKGDDINIINDIKTPTDAPKNEPTPVETPNEPEIFVPNNVTIGDPAGLRTHDITLFDAIITKNQGQNIFLSPLSIDLALGMLYNAADGSTYEAMHRYFGYDVDILNADADAITTHQTLEQETLANDPDATIFRICNGLWYDDNQIEVNQEFKDRLTYIYEAHIEALDFMAQNAANVINDWCSENTNGLIKNIVTPDIMRQCVAILANSLYFKGAWCDEFANAQPGDFTTFDGNTITTDMMRGKANTYMENDYATAFAKYYYNGYRFIGILPKTEEDFNIADLDINGLLESVVESYSGNVIVTMPKLNVTGEFDITNTLKELGLLELFTTSANFDKMSEDLRIDGVLHKTVLKIDEKGTEAAAVTAITVKANSMMLGDPIEIVLDRPFVLLIQDPYGNTLFVGKIINPNL